MIQAHGLAVQRAGQTLRFADVQVQPGGVLLLRGPSGSGKTTWLSLVAGLLQADQGQLTVAQTRLAPADTTPLRTQAQRDAWRARHIGWLPQRLHLSPALTVQDNLRLAFWAAGLPVDEARITQRLAALGVAELAGRKPHTLSGGQAQRVALARATLLQPPLLLADEPTASLDDEAAHQAMALLLEAAQATGATLVVATHDERMVSELARRAALGFCVLDFLVLQRFSDKESAL
ncbi:ABC transporter ATP-binding protein [Hydrogenophaga soli]